MSGYNLIPSGEGNEKPPLGKISPGKLQHGEDNLHSNRRRSESSMALEEEEEEDIILEIIKLVPDGARERGLVKTELMASPVSKESTEQNAFCLTQ